MGEPIDKRCQPPTTKPVRVSRYKWVHVDLVTGLDENGQKPIEWKSPMEDLRRKAKHERKLSKKRGRTLKNNRKKIHPKFLRRGTIIDINTKGDPDAKDWCDREPLEAYNFARLAYLQGTHSLREICEITGHEKKRLDYWSLISTNERMSWKEEKDIQQNATIKAILKSTKDQCVDIIKKTLDVVSTRVNEISEDSAKLLTIKEVQSLVGVCGDLHKISQLEMGQPTDIVTNIKVTRESVLKKLKAADPLMDYGEDADDKTAH